MLASLASWIKVGDLVSLVEWPQYQVVGVVKSEFDGFLKQSGFSFGISDYNLLKPWD